MNADTGKMGNLADLFRDAKPGERVIPATIIPASTRVPPETVMRQFSDGACSASAALRRGVKAFQTYGPRKPLREVRRELQEAAAAK